MRPIHRRLAATVVVLALGACGGSRPTTVGARPGAAGDAAAGVALLRQEYLGRAEMGDRSRALYAGIEDLLPSVRYARPAGAQGGYPSEHASTFAAVGTLLNVRAGRQYVVRGDDAPSGTPVAYDDTSAAKFRWFTLYADLRIEKCLGCSASGTVTLTLPSGGPDRLGAEAAGLESLGRLVVVASDDTPLTADEPGKYAVMGDWGVVIAPVAGDGSLSLPFAPDREARVLLSHVRTLASLEAAADAPRTVPLTVKPGYPGLVRADGADARAWDQGGCADGGPCV